jgi:sulfatase maturation enzyme AslB (radical SAM superfamily)
MKQSRYVVGATGAGGEHLLYNVENGAFVQLGETAYAAWKNDACAGELADALAARGLLTERSPEEQLGIQQRLFARERAQTESLELSIVPTYACNYRCPYCYELGHNKIKGKMDERTAQEIKTDKSKLKKAEKRIVQLEKVLNKLYEDRALEKITEERYVAMNSQYETEYNELKAQAQSLHDRITATETATMNAQIFSDLIEKYADLQELNARILNELIERIVIHEKEIINGEKYQTVEIFYKFVGVI